MFRCLGVQVFIGGPVFSCFAAEVQYSHFFEGGDAKLAKPAKEERTGQTTMADASLFSLSGIRTYLGPKFLQSDTVRLVLAASGILSSLMLYGVLQVCPTTCLFSCIPHLKSMIFILPAPASL